MADRPAWMLRITRHRSTGWLAVIAAYVAMLALIKASHWQTVKRRMPPVTLWSAADTLSTGRSWVAVRWDTIRVIEGVKGAAIAEPRDVTATASGYVISDGRTRLVGTSVSGDILWTFGRPRRSQLEVPRFAAVHATSDGAVIALDQLDASLLRFDQNGVMTGRTALRALATSEGPQLPTDFAPLAKRRYALLYPDVDSGIAVFNADAGSYGWIPLPWRDYVRIHPMARQSTLRADLHGTWALLFHFGDGWFSFDDTTASSVIGRFARFTPFPTVVTVTRTNTLKRQSRATTTLLGHPDCSACAATVANGRLYVIGKAAAGQTSVVDVFDARSKEYRFSLTLPCVAVALAVRDTQLAVVASDQQGTRILVLEPRGTSNPLTEAAFQEGPTTGVTSRAKDAS